MNIKEILFTAITREPDPREEGIHVTQVAKLLKPAGSPNEEGCKRQIYYELTEPYSPHDSESAMVFFRGQAFHRELAYRFSKMGWETEQRTTDANLIGTFDAYHPLEHVLVDFKTATFVPKNEEDFKKYYGHYITQVRLYAAQLIKSGRPVTEIHIVFIGVGNEEFRLKDIKTFPVSFTADVLSTLYVAASNLVTEIQSMLIMGKTPPRNAGWPCTYCSFLVKCYSEKP